MNLLLRITALLPLPVAHAIGYLFGWLFYLVQNPHREIARRNIALCLPELSPRERRHLLRRVLIETGKTAMESPIMWLSSRTRTLSLIREVEGQEVLDQALGRGKGGIIAAPHLGSWELVSLYCSTFSPSTSLYRPLRRPSLEPLIHKARTRFGANLVPTDTKGVRALFQALAANELVVIPPDQDPRDAGGVFVPFFGIQANTMTLVSRLAQKSGATPVLGVAERLSWGRGFRMHYFPIEIDNDSLEGQVAAINRTLEEAVRRFPAQYQWSYKRFRTRPEGEGAIY
jgi:Kdo2-lipid IVA lauroyltransferase/acyltransferase